MSKRKIAVVAMSGGVDSSAAAALLLEEGYDVRGVSLRIFDPGACQEDDEKTCCSARDIRDARRVAAMLDIPFTCWDVRDAFTETVIEPFVRAYGEGRTPNPCVLCNSRIKFDLLLREAQRMGADFLATGHYARIEQAGGEPELRRGADRQKDQSYFLFDIDRDALPKILFPLGGLGKDEVRRAAADRGLPVAEKRESQEVCFIPDNDYGSFVARRLGDAAPPAGAVVGPLGEELGRHGGFIRYTIGQRRGLGIAAPAPLYVTAIDAGRNQIVVGPDEDLFSSSFTVVGMNWLTEPGARELRADVKIRYRHPGAAAAVQPEGRERCRVLFDEPQRAVTPGQAAVLYRGDAVVGGGWIDAVG
jgi:tRNA-specific 2-thiouridylase